MNAEQFWKNFSLGQELNVSGTFIYNGLRRFYELDSLDYPEESFEVLYNLSMGLERLLKIAVVLLEHDANHNQEEFEESLKTHSHHALLNRVKKLQPNINFGPIHNELLELLGNFYINVRYDRFSIESIGDLQKEREALCKFLSKHLKIEISRQDSIFGTPNEIRYKKFLQKTVRKISDIIYKIITEQASRLGLYTYELRDGSKAQTVFLGGVDMYDEDVLWKELLIFFMNTKQPSGYLDFLRDIPPLEFDPGLISEYLACFQSDAAKSYVQGELEELYNELDDKRGRLEQIDVIGANGIYFDDPDTGEEEGESETDLSATDPPF